MINLLFVICAIDILYLINKIPNLFIENRLVMKYFVKNIIAIVLIHLLLKAYTIITFKDCSYLEIRAIILIVIYTTIELVVNLRKW